MKRAKKAYILFTISNESSSRNFNPSIQCIKTEILNNITLLFGQLTNLRLSKEFTVLYYNSSTKYGIVQVNNDFYQEILCCLIIIKNLAKHVVDINIVHIGRTLKMCKKLVVDDYLDLLEKGVTRQMICNTSSCDVDIAIESLKSISLVPH